MTECGTYALRFNAGQLDEDAPAECPKSNKCTGLKCVRFGLSQPTNMRIEIQDVEQNRALGLAEGAHARLGLVNRTG
jgi:hypothetical protein